VARMPSIAVICKAFVSFRVGDADDAAALVDQALCRAFGTDRVFRSSHAMYGGAQFPPTLEAEAADCAVMVVVVGDRWLAENDGARRIDDPRDWVRKEIEFALASRRPVISVLAGDRAPLSADDHLPVSLKELLDRPQLRFRSSEADLARVKDEVRQHLDDEVRPARPVRLVTLHPVARSSDVRLGPAEINGEDYGESIVFRAFASLISFNLGMRYRRLEVTVAARDGVFTVIGDGRVLAQVAATRAEPRRLTIDVTDVVTLKLTAHRSSGDDPELTWGDPVVHP
jgi:hypothetical protein